MMVQPWVFYYEDSMNDDLFQEPKKSLEEFDNLNKEDQRKECEKNLKNPEFLWSIPGENNEKCSDN